MAKAALDRYLVMAIVSADQNDAFGWAEGMLGVCPVFLDKEKADEYAKRIGGADVLRMVSTGKQGVDPAPLKNTCRCLDAKAAKELTDTLIANGKKKPRKVHKDLVERYRDQIHKF